ncbi:alcohol dehydrogenase catalytic domain-containing protein [Streptomyces sp. NBC_01381]|uniref:quinone oxidoreductase family protein n=1 Tax=Streptomyces sp. NBC_01381 TaxID=2903845 RepID=UPI002257117F|nr:alcohol dehydrogenase catalytic domain-containing protein [Streptomyces sp. NBC_01381]MCX4669220.1 alcohol dehydrogenase catalytic domain-containing protein [Streptomyces sp. NBC_01381]
MTIPEFGTADVLRLAEVKTPEPGPGQVSIEVAYAGANFAEVPFRQGVVDVPLPYVPGIEVSGHVRVLGEGGEGLTVGQPVAALTIVDGGGYGEVVTTAAELVAPLDGSGLGLDVAAVLPSNSTTAFLVLERVAGLQRGERVLVHAAAGGVGSQLGQVARLLGAGRVVGTVGSAAKIDVAKARPSADIGSPIRPPPMPFRCAAGTVAELPDPRQAPGLWTISAGSLGLRPPRVAIDLPLHLAGLVGQHLKPGLGLVRAGLDACRVVGDDLAGQIHGGVDVFGGSALRQLLQGALDRGDAAACVDVVPELIVHPGILAHPRGCSRTQPATSPYAIAILRPQALQHLPAGGPRTARRPRAEAAVLMVRRVPGAQFMAALAGDHARLQLRGQQRVAAVRAARQHPPRGGRHVGAVQVAADGVAEFIGLFRGEHAGRARRHGLFARREGVGGAGEHLVVEVVGPRGKAVEQLACLEHRVSNGVGAGARRG